MNKNTKAYIMLVLATLFWAGNFTVGKFAFLENIPPYTLAFFRWVLVWLILLPFTFKEILNLKTLVQIESLKSELANLKILSSKRK